MKLTWTLLFFWFLSFPGPATPREPDHPGFISVLWVQGKAWFGTPGGKPFLSLGVNAIGDQSYRAPNRSFYDPVKNQYRGDKEAWVRSVLARLKRWNFNTIGCWSDEGLWGRKVPFTVILYLGRGTPWDRVLDSVFSRDFEERVRENAQKAARFRNDPSLLGYFLDNEMPWWGEFGWKTQGQKTLLEKTALGGVENADKAALIKFFKARYGENLDAFEKTWRVELGSFEDLNGPITLKAGTRAQKSDADAWAGWVAERYFSVAVKALRAVDPNHLVLGVRFAGETPWSVVEACGKYCDILSVNLYSKTGEADRALLDNFFAKSGKPLLVSEYSFSGMENQSGDPNTHGADVSVPTQMDRAEHFERFSRELLDLPYLAGMHWFEWADESPEGRFDGEDQNYGLVDIRDKEYPLLTQTQAKLNRMGAGIHEKSGSPLPKAFLPTGDSQVRPGEPGVRVESVRRFLKIDASAHVDTWGDTATGGKMVANTTSGVIVSEFQTGTGWGCGESCFCNVPPLLAWGTADLRGYAFLDFQAFVPKGIRFSVFVSEAGAAAANLSSYEGLNGSDGESFEFPELQGAGHWESYHVDLSDLERRTVWGNQKGNNILDLQALHDVQFFLPGNQGAGKILVKDLEFKVE